MTIAPIRIPGSTVVTTQQATDYWQAKLDQFRDINDREPREDSSDMEERRLAKAAWGYKLSGNPSQQHAPMAAVGTDGSLELSAFLHTIGWEPDDAEAVFDSPEVRWSANFNAVTDWCYYMQSQPRHDNCSDERKLGLWLRAERRAMEDGHLGVEKGQALSSLDAYPVRPTPARPSLDMARAAVRWFERHETSANRFGSPIEALLAKWISKHRAYHNDGTLSPEIAAILSATPHWLTARTGKTHGGEDARRWRRNLHEVAHWKETHGYLPITRGGGGTEMRLSYWLQAQRDLHKAGRLRQEHIDALSALGAWFDGDIPERTLEFFQEHGRWPSVQADDAVERTLANAARHRRDEIIALGVPRQRQLLEQSVWDDKFCQLRSWTEAHGRLPKMRAPDKHESMLANFINRQRRDLAAGKLSTEREELLRTISGVLEQRVKERSVEEWQALLEAFIEEHGRIPSSQSADANERSLGCARYRYRLGTAAYRRPCDAASWQDKIDAHLLEHGTLPSLSATDPDIVALARARRKHKLAPQIPQMSRAARQQVLDTYIEELRHRGETSCRVRAHSL